MSMHLSIYLGESLLLPSFMVTPFTGWFKKVMMVNLFFLTPNKTKKKSTLLYIILLVKFKKAEVLFFWDTLYTIPYRFNQGLSNLSL